ncbi:hypothetical protein C4D60_Mb04t29950 [Musa balbisiana]|uniref:Uncharacterized protein n=1 Tax=Musa balbisiana TaxID=52838 RepID=A0A4S8KFM9_MUSBA|nr:hypothetical protein C4D60_Mb04t29950 [Musa balbisiana]
MASGNAEYDAKRQALYEYYHPLEISPTIPIKEKTKLMEEWYAKSEDVGPFTIVRSLGSYPFNPLIGSRIQAKRWCGGALNSTIREWGTPLVGNSMSLR